MHHTLWHMFSLSSVFFKLSSALAAVHYFKIGLVRHSLKLIQCRALQGKKMTHHSAHEHKLLLII